MNLTFLTQTVLFRGIGAAEAEAMLHCLQAYEKSFQKGEAVFRAGARIDSAGLVLSGSVTIEQNDVWGNTTILARAEKGELFAEAYACAGDILSDVDVIASAETRILFLNAEKVLKTCPSGCEFHSRAIRNLLSVMAHKNLELTRKISLITPKSIRSRLVGYLSLEASKQGCCEFDIPFNRAQLSDYLCVDRSALSNELSKMQKEGLIEYGRNHFRIINRKALG